MKITELLESSKCVRKDVKLSDINWFRVGGTADYYYKAQTESDLIILLESLTEDFPLCILGVGSNVIIRDGGVEGVVLRLGRGFAGIEKINDVTLKVGAAALDLSVAKYAQIEAISGLEFLSGIPGTIGGAIKMNGGSYNSEMKDILVEATAYDRRGKLHIIKSSDMNFSYRDSNPHIKDLIFTQAIIRGSKGDADEIKQRMDKIQQQRSTTQPIKSRTGGSSFKNPVGYKAWELIDKAGMRGHKIGGAMISEKHCNFMINDGTATAKDLIALGEFVRSRVKEISGISLEWEIQIIGRDEK
ncbi:MAG: UDP-N-acetylmuramate dehydrogenase [Rickettsiales bacterium]|jgi:UDP-N-acetylmuramate dehydrogenase|nr:UDP-N-acetylmuramate dehydrogenase [Rickettsiales bacterium]